MRVLIQNRQRKYQVNRGEVLRWAGHILSKQKVDGEVGLVFVNDRQIQGYNRDYRRKDRPTNVLAFPMLEGVGGRLHPEFLGDVMISLQRVDEEAPLYGRSYSEHLRILLIHGLLHLLGYDHERSPREARRMRRREKLLFRTLK